MLSNTNKVFRLSNAMLKPEILTRSKLNKFSTDGLKVNHDSSNNQFYIEMDSTRAFVDYEKKGSSIKFTHTEVPEIFRGKGVAKILAQEVFSYAVKNNLNVQVECDYLKNYYDTNRDKYKHLKVL